MTACNRCWLTVLLLLLAGTTLPAVAGEVLHEKIDALEPFLGAWELEARWVGGEPLWAQSRFRPILGGAFVEAVTFVREGDGKVYQRYRSILGWDTERQTLASWDFVHDGSMHAKPFRAERTEHGLIYETDWLMGETQIREKIEIGADGQQRWQVWAAGPEPDSWDPMMDGRWRRIAPNDVIVLPAPAGLDESLAALDPLLGSWEIASTGPDGEPFWTRDEYRAGLNGLFLDTTTYALSDAGDVFQRNETVYLAHADEGRFDLLTFSSAGIVRRASVEVSGAPDRPRIEIALVDAVDVPYELEWLVQFESERAFDWQVRSRPNGSGDWKAILDGVWLSTGEPRRGQEMTSPIDDGPFADSGTELRSFVKERVIAAPLSEVFAAWTDEQGWSQVYGDPAASRIELAIGGRYEWMFDGHIGSNGCQVLSYIPGRMISFSWGAPPAQAENRLRRTWVVVETEPADEGATLVRLTHLGFGDGERWDETFAYFEAAWERVLDAMQAGLAAR